MKLSVIIVNYNVRYFLEQALLSVQKAMERVPETEVFVVDNNSADGSVEMVRERFPWVILEANKDNTGFARANNQAMRVAKGEYVLLLNPDTVVAEDTFEICLRFMDAHPQAGGLGVKMIDGTGAFLPESKRGFPSPMVAFYKTFGLSKFFPRSPRFNRYHLGYLDKNKNHEIEILSGAFMLMRKKALDEVGLLDEAFFMYGEDIDLSYRLLLGGYQNHYLADATIIHYKGESTKKGSLNYVKTFYQAMIIFARKHFKGRQAWWFVALLQMAIYFRATLTLLGNIARKTYRPLLDAALIYGGLWAVKEGWEWLHFGDPHYYDYQSHLLTFNFPLYTAIWVAGIYLRGGYDAHPTIGQLLTGVGGGTLFIAAIYGFLPVDYRSSRMLILLGAIFAAIGTLAIRAAMNWLRQGKIGLEWSNISSPNVVVVGSADESKRVLHLLYQSHIHPNFIGTVAAQPQADTKQFLGGLEQLEEIVHWYNVEEIIFCSKDIDYQSVIAKMERLGDRLRYKILPAGSDGIIGSNSKNTAGDLYTVDIHFHLATPFHRRNKWLFDIFACGLLLILLPVLLILVRRRAAFLSNWWRVLLGKKTWVGYIANDPQIALLPRLPQGVLSPLQGFDIQPNQPDTLHRLNLFYAKDYSVYTDWRLLWKGLRSIGN